MTWYNPVDDFRSVKHAVEGSVRDVVDAGSALFGDSHPIVKDGALPKIASDITHLDFGDVWKQFSPQVREAVSSSFLVRDGGQVITKEIPRLFDDVTSGNIIGAVKDGVQEQMTLAHDLGATLTGNMPVDCWTHGAIMEATLSSKGENSKEWADDLSKLDTLWDGSSNPPGYGATSRGDSKYYDDNAWIGIALMDANKQNPNNPFYLQRAKQVFDLMKQGADTDQMPHPGGVFWKQGEKTRNAVSTGGATQLALQLYQQTHDEQYLQFAKKQFAWEDNTLKADNGLYNDNIGADGKINGSQFSYNQGLMLGNATLLYQSTGDKRYLDEAQDIAKKSLAQFGADGNGPYSKQSPMFGAVYFKNLMALDAVAPDNSYRVGLKQYQDTLKKHLADPNNQDDWSYLDPNPTNAYAGAEQVYALAGKYPPVDH